MNLLTLDLNKNITYLDKLEEIVIIIYIYIYIILLFFNYIYIYIYNTKFY